MALLKKIIYRKYKYLPRSMVCKPSFSIILMLNYPPIGKQKSANWNNGENPPAGKKPANTDYSTNCRKGINP